MPKPTKENCTGGRWTQAEHELFIKGMSIHGRRWTKVADIVGTRTTVQVRSHAQKWEIKAAKDQKPGDMAQQPQFKRMSEDGRPNNNTVNTNMNSFINGGNEMLGGSGGGYGASSSLPPSMSMNSSLAPPPPVNGYNNRVPPPKPPRVGRPTTQEVKDIIGDSLKRRASASPPPLRFSHAYDKGSHSGASPRTKSQDGTMPFPGLHDQTILREPLNSDWGNFNAGGAISMPDVVDEDIRRPFSFDDDEEDDEEDEEDDDGEEGVSTSGRSSKAILSNNLWDLAWDDDGADNTNAQHGFNPFISSQLGGGGYQGGGFTPGVAGPGSSHSNHRNSRSKSPRASLSRSRSRSSYSSSLGRSNHRSGGGGGEDPLNYSNHSNHSNHSNTSGLSNSNHGGMNIPGAAGEAAAVLARLEDESEMSSHMNDWRDTNADDTDDTESMCSEQVSDYGGNNSTSFRSTGPFGNRSRNSSRSEQELTMFALPVEQLEDMYSQFDGQQLNDIDSGLDIMSIDVLDDNNDTAELAAAAAFAADAVGSPNQSAGLHRREGGGIGNSLKLPDSDKWPSWEEQAISEEQAAWEGMLAETDSNNLGENSMAEEEATQKYQQNFHRRHQEQQYRQMHQEQQEHYLRYIQQRAQQLAQQQQRLKEQVKQNNHSLQRLNPKKKQSTGSGDFSGESSLMRGSYDASRGSDGSVSSSERLSATSSGTGGWNNSSSASQSYGNLSDSASPPQASISPSSSNSTSPRISSQNHPNLQSNLTANTSSPTNVSTNSTDSIATNNSSLSTTASSNSVTSSDTSSTSATSISQLLPACLPPPQPPTNNSSTNNSTNNGNKPPTTNNSSFPAKSNNSNQPSSTMSPSAQAVQQHHQNVAAVHAMMTGQFPPFGYPPPFAYNPAFQQQLQMQLRQAASNRQQFSGQGGQNQNQNQNQNQSNTSHASHQVLLQGSPDFARMFQNHPNMNIYQPPTQQKQQQQQQESDSKSA